jgi:hypothetical protein
VAASKTGQVALLVAHSSNRVPSLGVACACDRLFEHPTSCASSGHLPPASERAVRISRLEHSPTTTCEALLIAAVLLFWFTISCALCAYRDTRMPAAQAAPGRWPPLSRRLERAFGASGAAYAAVARSTAQSTPLSPKKKQPTSTRHQVSGTLPLDPPNPRSPAPVSRFLTADKRTERAGRSARHPPSRPEESLTIPRSCFES